MEHDYRALMEKIYVPREVNERVLLAAREKTEEHTKKNRFLWRAAACGALALILAVGGIMLRTTETTMEASGEKKIKVVSELGLTAYAAGLGANGGVLLEAVEGQDLSALDGTTQTLSLTFADGREATGTYHLRKERLKTSVREDGSKVLVPVLEGDTAETVAGMYAVSAEESCWLLWPVSGSSTVSLSAPYGLRAETNYFHSGIDIPADRGESITAAAEGTVTEAGFDAQRGNYVVLDHGEGLTTSYSHCQEVQAEEGDAVEAGEPIALIGATGMATGPHLHFEVRQDGATQNPVAYFNAELRDTLKMG